MSIAPDWQAQAACRDANPGRFMSQRVGEQVQTIREFCEPCPVRSACLDHAINRPEPIGIWGGTTARQRRTHITLLDARKARL